MSVDLLQWIPNSLKRSQFWKDFLEVFAEEMDLLREEKIKPLDVLFNLRENDNSECLVEVAKGYGFNPDRSIDDSLEFIRRDVESIGYRKKFKTIYGGYEYIYKSIDYNGQVFIVFYNGSKVMRAYDPQNISNIKQIIDDEGFLITPYLWLAEKNFSEFITGDLFYDNNPVLNYDIQGTQYDVATTLLTTKHVALEYFLDRTIAVEGNTYLMTNDYFEYLFNGAEYNRRAIEVPHAGCQMTLIADISGYYDVYSQPHSINAIEADFAINTLTYVSGDYVKVKIGTGVQSLPSEQGGGIFPTDLAEPLYESILEEEEVYMDSDLSAINVKINIENIKDVELSPTATSLISIVVENVPIQRESVKVTYAISGSDYIALDDGEGNITGTNITSGTIDYITGQIDITFSTATDDKVVSAFNYNSLYKETNPNWSLTEITEIGIYNSLEELIAYGTFPPIQYNDNRFHNSYQLIIYNIERDDIEAGSPDDVNPDEYDAGSPDDVNPDTINGGIS